MSENAIEFIESISDADYRNIPQMIRNLPNVRDCNGRRKYTKEDIDEIREFVLNGTYHNDIESTGRKITASKMWRFNRSYSKHPVALCGNREIGLPVCHKGEGKFCYCKDPCTSHVSLDGKPISKEVQREIDKMVRDCQERNKEALEEYEREMNAIDFDEMTRRILGG